MPKILNYLTLGVLSATLFSAFIYLDHFGFNYKALNSILAILAFYSFLSIPKRSILFAGFFIGIFWFYWIGYSFKYNGVGYLEPFISLAFGFIYMLFFSPLAFSQKSYIRAILLLLLSFVEPMDFNWLVMQLPLVDTFFGLSRYHFVALLIALALFLEFGFKKISLISLVFLALALNFTPPKQQDAPLKIKLIQTDISQNIKWSKDNLQKTVDGVFSEIKKAIDDGYDIILFPESALPLFLNHQPLVELNLLDLSNSIGIVVGSLYEEDGQNYNVTYAFDNGIRLLAKKMILVPFGEYIPLPSFLRDRVNNYFFGGASDFKTASKPTDFTLRGVKFRNAICYEASREELYADSPRFMLASSNNAWFSPSIEPTLQKLLISFYARKYNTTVYHSTNYLGAGVIK